MRRGLLELEPAKEREYIPTPLVAAVSTLFSDLTFPAWLRSKVQSSKHPFLAATKTSPWTRLVFCV